MKNNTIICHSSKGLSNKHTLWLLHGHLIQQKFYLVSLALIQCKCQLWCRLDHLCSDMYISSKGLWYSVISSFQLYLTKVLWQNCENQEVYEMVAGLASDFSQWFDN